MRRDSGTTDSVWRTTRTLPTDGPVLGNLQCDVCVIGAGVVGLQTAYRLMQAGMSVVVLDDGPPGGGETARTTAHIVTAIDDRYHQIDRVHGRRNTRLVAQSHAWAVEATRDLVRSERIACEWRSLPGYLFTPPGAKSILPEEMFSAERAGCPGVSWAERAPMPGMDTGRCLRFEGQGQLDALKFIRGIVATLRRGGVRIHAPAHALKTSGGDPMTVHVAGGGSVTAKSVIEATNSPVFGHHAIALKQFPYRTYVIAAPIDAKSLEPSLLWDTADPYHYVRLAKPANAADNLLVVGGGDHHTGERRNGDAIHQSLYRWAKARFPKMGPIEKAWSGQVWEPVDHLAFIGRVPHKGRLFIATGDSGNGWTHGAIASRLLTDLVTDRENPWTDIYSPHRKSAAVAPNWIAEATHMLSKLPRHFRAPDVKSTDDLAPGEGGLVRRGLRLVACYRDEDGKVHERSAICRHLGCVVDWNSNEKTWDCPCHGSRFDRFGTVVSGPANEDLRDTRPPSGQKRPARPRRADGVRAPRKGKGIVVKPPKE